MLELFHRKSLDDAVRVILLGRASNTIVLGNNNMMSVHPMKRCLNRCSCMISRQALRELCLEKSWYRLILAADLASSFPDPDQLGESQKPSEASQYLPRGQKYQQCLVDSAKNPRQGVPVSKWISTWNADNAREEAQPAR